MSPSRRKPSNSAGRARKATIAEIDARLKPTPSAVACSVGRARAKPTAKTPKPAKPKRVSALDAAAQVLAGSKVPMRAKELIAEMEKQGLWKSPGGKTPEATLYAAMIREIAAKGDKARFKKHERGVFVPGKAC
jgi:hypothetical protein